MNILGLARHGLNNFEQMAVIFVLTTAFISLIYAWLLRNNVMKKDKGDEEMQKVKRHPHRRGQLSEPPVANHPYTQISSSVRYIYPKINI